MFLPFLVVTEIGALSKSFCELSGRCEPVIADVILGFVEMGKVNEINSKLKFCNKFSFLGYDFNNLDGYIKSNKHSVLPSLQSQQPQKQLNMLSAGTKQPLPPYIPQHFPPFPDPHAYVRTPVSTAIS